MRLFPLLFAMALAILFAGCAQEKTGEEMEKIEAEKPSSAELENASNVMGASQAEQPPCSEGNVIQKDECFVALAKEKSDSGLCKRIYSIDRRDLCYAQFAEADLEACRKIHDAGKRADCLVKNAVRQKDDGICKEIGNDDARAECLRKVVPPCMLILNEDERDLCLALEKNDYTRCKSDFCFEGYAKNRSFAEACARISKPAEKFKCIALVEKSFFACRLSEQEAVRDSCIEEASKELDQQSGCDFATPGSKYANNCYLHFAVKNNDPAICRKILQERDQDWCYSRFASLKANATSCARVIESLNRISCYRNAAIENRMPSLCNGLGNSAWMRDCYAASILYIDAGPVPSDCKSVESNEWKNKCYLRAAIKSNNGTYCSFIEEGAADRRDCEELFPQVK
ncbi:MAG: hypothetical protein N3F07_03200 [Candidatus Micrarchaeota archaeon]|nr:hypothetical protein [Candidatus Micrarchaeota archaeon]